MIAVVLGAPTNATRFADVMRLVQKTLAANGAPQS
jgi:D-alanyl-D-alanine carboxypeptidase